MAYSADLVRDIKRTPKTLGSQLGRAAIRHQLSVLRIAEATGASRQTVYNWFRGGVVLGAYRPYVEALLTILQTSATQDEAWRKICKTFKLDSSRSPST